jgi:hypothetical protein
MQDGALVLALRGTDGAHPRTPYSRFSQSRLRLKLLINDGESQSCELS